MKVLCLSTNEMEGGAGRAAWRLHQAFIKQGMDAKMLVQNKSSENKLVLSEMGKLARGLSAIRPTIDLFPQYMFAPKNRDQFSFEWFFDGLPAKIDRLDADIVNLHWVCKGFVQIESLAHFGRPIVWTLHDMWPFTGGCHHSGDCLRFKDACGSCPVLDSQSDHDLSRWVWKRKRKSWRDLDLTIISPSSWLADRARQSSLFQGLRIEVIANGIDLQKFKPIDRSLARSLLGLPEEKKLILYNAVRPASNHQKGSHLLPAILQKVVEGGLKDEVELIVPGKSRLEDETHMPVPTNYLGYLQDEVSLALMAAAVDLLLVPSFQENLPNTIMEAMACGTPGVAFSVGGIPDMIDHYINGYLARPGDVDDMAVGIVWALNDPENLRKLGKEARLKAENAFDLERQAHKYLNLFEEISKKRA